jgi:hypothetical protein
LLLPKPSLPAETSASQKSTNNGRNSSGYGTASNPRESVAISLQQRKFEDANAFDFEIAMRWDGMGFKRRFHA